jgi:hypothetical protein
MMLELNYMAVPNNIEIGGGVWGKSGKSSAGFGYLFHNIFFVSAYVNRQTFQ